jgi:peptide-methionine (S)-S-oxide reductase
LKGVDYTKKIVLSAGCFWGVEEFLSRIPGVLETEVGYSNGRIKNPTYEDVCYKNTYFAETCLVTYDENKVSLEYILKEYWSIIDPTSLNRQGNDIGCQYRTGIYYIDDSDLNIILKSKYENQKNYDKKIVTEVKPL